MLLNPNPWEILYVLWRWHQIIHSEKCWLSGNALLYIEVPERYQLETWTLWENLFWDLRRQVLLTWIPCNVTYAWLMCKPMHITLFMTCLFVIWQLMVVHVSAQKNVLIYYSCLYVRQDNVNVYLVITIWTVLSAVYPVRTDKSIIHCFVSNANHYFASPMSYITWMSSFPIV